MYKGAIIGFGKIAQTNHLSAYKSNELKDIVQIVAVVESNKFNLEKSRNDYPELHFYKNVEKLFENEKIDFVDIATPPDSHYEIIAKCISKNVHIICEKPFTIDVSHAEKLKQMLLDSEIVFIPCHQYKHSPVWKEFKNFIDAMGSRSKVLAQFNVFRTEADPGLAQISEKWRIGSKVVGGGILADTGVHYLYLAAWMLGEIEGISTQLLNLRTKIFQSEDTAVIILTGGKGVAQITLTWAADKRFNSSSIVCSNSSLYYTGGTSMISHTNQGMTEIKVPDMSDKVNYTSLYINLFTDFFNAIKNNKRNDEWINEAFQTVQLMDKCYTASEEEKTIKLKNEK